MARDPKYDILFEPVRIGPKTMRNRFMQVPHCTGFGSDLPGTQAVFRGMKAEGGWAAVNTEAVTTGPQTDFSPQKARLWDEHDARGWAWMVERVHEHDALAGIELHGGGSANLGWDTRQPALHVSRIADMSMPMAAVQEMDRGDIRRVQESYVRAAKLARSIGFDIINIHGAEASVLPVMFLMRTHNTRTDEYGGSLENRARFWLETLEMVREAVGDDCAVAARLCVDTLHDSDEGVRVDEEGIGFIELADHLVDFWDVQVGGEIAEHWVKDAGASRFYAEDFQGAWVRKIRPYTDKPIVGVGRFTSPDTMVELVRSRRLDIIGAARPSIADPFIPRKIEEGRPEDIRECIGCNICVSRVNGGQTLICTQNATSGEEYRRGWHPERFEPARNADQDVLVVGGGPAGMECALVLGRRGMRRVHLVDADAELGGHYRWVPQLPGLGQWERVVAWRRGQLDKLRNVTVVPNLRLHRDAVLDYGAEIVVVATGSTWATNGLGAHNRTGIPGVDVEQPWCLTPEQIMVEGKQAPGERVVVYDDEGYFVGMGLAERLAAEGRRVTYVTPHSVPARYTALTGELVDLLPHVVELGIEIVTAHRVTSVGPDGAVGAPIAWRGPEVRWDADAVVLATQRIADDTLYRELKADPAALEEAGIVGLYRVGDAVAPRQQVADAIFDGHRLAREIDSPDPAIPLSYVRERRVIGATDEDFEAMRGVPKPI